MSSVSISVIIPFLNPGDKLKKSIGSVLKDNPEKVEIIVWNDGSNDGEDYRTLCNSFAQVSYNEEPNQGVSIARNKAARLAKGKYLIFLDSDDWFEPDGINSFLEVITQDASLDLVFSWSRIHDLKTGKTEEWNKFNQMIFAGSLISYSNLAGTFLIRTEVFKKVGGYNSRLRFSENLDLITRVLSLGELEIFYLEKITVNFGNSLQTTRRNGKFSQQLLLDSLAEYYKTNQVFLQENRRFEGNIICRIIVASIFLGRKDLQKEYLAKLKKMANPRYSKFFWLSRIAPIYRMYLSHKGFRD
jgi:glycosyltransferase involved in cell wall biosynthesis